MYEEFKELYNEMKEEILKKARCKPLVMTRLSMADEDTQSLALAWLKLFRGSEDYFRAKQRYKELPDSRLEYYKMNGMTDLPEVAYRRIAFKELRQLWADTLPDIVRRKDAKEKADQEDSSGTECEDLGAGCNDPDDVQGTQEEGSSD